MVGWVCFHWGFFGRQICRLRFFSFCCILIGWFLDGTGRVCGGWFVLIGWLGGRLVDWMVVFIGLVKVRL